MMAISLLTLCGKAVLITRLSRSSTLSGACFRTDFRKASATDWSLHPITLVSTTPIASFTIHTRTIELFSGTDLEQCDHGIGKYSLPGKSLTFSWEFLTPRKPRYWPTPSV